MPYMTKPKPSVLLAFKARNVLSFRDEFEFSMLATALAETDARRSVEWREDGRPIDVLPVAAIFGANASGKTNVLRAMHDMRSLVLQSFRQAPTGGIPQKTFRLDPASAHAPSMFEIDIVLGGVRHEYGFEFDRERVIEEWAIRYPRGRSALLFHRHGKDVEVGTVERAKSRAVTELLRPNALFLSTAAQTNHPVLLPLYEWFMPLLHLDARPDLVQCIKWCEHRMGRGTWRTRPPRLALQGEDLAHVERVMDEALAKRPRLPDVGLPVR